MDSNPPQVSSARWDFLASLANGTSTAEADEDDTDVELDTVVGNKAQHPLKWIRSSLLTAGAGFSTVPPVSLNLLDLIDCDEDFDDDSDHEASCPATSGVQTTTVEECSTMLNTWLGTNNVDCRNVANASTEIWCDAIQIIERDRGDKFSLHDIRKLALSPAIARSLLRLPFRAIVASSHQFGSNDPFDSKLCQFEELWSTMQLLLESSEFASKFEFEQEILGLNLRSINRKVGIELDICAIKWWKANRSHRS